MGWFNYYGLAIVAVMMIPNIVYAVKHKDAPADTYKNKAVAITEQIGRYGCIALMIFNIPYTYAGFWFSHALVVYLAVNGGLLLAYIVFWIVCFNRKGLLRALSLSLLPSCIFLFCGVLLTYIPLLVFAMLFGASHTLISCKNATEQSRRKKPTVNQKIRDEVILLFVILLLALAIIGTIFGL